MLLPKTCYSPPIGSTSHVAGVVGRCDISLH
jgi:hypothetical protein